MVHSSGQGALPEQTDDADPGSCVVRWLYRLVALVSAVFILTIFVMVAVTLSDPAVPANEVMSGWLDRYSAILLTAEVATIGVLVVLAFILDRRESMKRYHREYARWERRMQQLAEENVTNHTHTGDAE